MTAFEGTECNHCGNSVREKEPRAWLSVQVRAWSGPMDACSFACARALLEDIETVTGERRAHYRIRENTEAAAAWERLQGHRAW